MNNQRACHTLTLLPVLALIAACDGAEPQEDGTT
jgi:hypothetical protein